MGDGYGPPYTCSLMVNIMGERNETGTDVYYVHLHVTWHRLSRPVDTTSENNFFRVYNYCSMQ